MAAPALPLAVKVLGGIAATILGGGALVVIDRLPRNLTQLAVVSAIAYAVVRKA